MKIAIPTRNEMVDEHFGHCEYFTLFTVKEDNTISESEIFESGQECGCKSDLAGALSEKGVGIMLAGGMGQGAVNKLASARHPLIF